VAPSTTTHDRYDDINVGLDIHVSRCLVRLDGIQDRKISDFSVSDLVNVDDFRSSEYIPIRAASAIFAVGHFVRQLEYIHEKNPQPLIKLVRYFATLANASLRSGKDRYDFLVLTNGGRLVYMFGTSEEAVEALTYMTIFEEQPDIPNSIRSKAVHIFDRVFGKKNSKNLDAIKATIIAPLFTKVIVPYALSLFRVEWAYYVEKLLDQLLTQVVELLGTRRDNQSFGAVL
jgi:hypothetical protein